MSGNDPFGWVGATIAKKFRVDAVAGAGAFGVVYRGFHLDFKMPIAVKCLKLATITDPRQREAVLASFNAEAPLLHQLSRNTPHIVQALDMGAETSPDGFWTPYIAMEWLAGETLEQHLRRHPEGLGLDEAIRLLDPIARALAIAHEHHVSHRDVKPQNLFLATREGRPGECIPKILDFGIAKVVAEAPSLTQAVRGSASAFSMCTPEYGAPEQFVPDFGATGPWTDVYALALVLIEVATGQPALLAGNAVQLARASCNESNRPSLKARRPEVSAEVESVLQQALAVQPALRFLHAGEMWAALTAAYASGRASMGPLPGLTVPPGPRVSIKPPGPTAAADGPGNHDAPTARGDEPGPRISVSPPGPTAAPAAEGGAPTAAGERPRPAATGENRICTAMLIDLSTTAALVARVDPSEALDVVERCMAVVRQQVEQLGGSVDMHASDSALAVFGAVCASDGDAERAVLAALRIQAALGNLALPRELRSVRPAARIGISTGRVFAGSPSRGTRRGFAVAGEPVTIAACLQQTAETGWTVISNETHRQVVGRFNVGQPAFINVPGRERVPAYRVLGPIAFRHVMVAPDFYGLATKLAGRRAELERLTGALDTVVEDRRSLLVTLAGASGVGRTRLLAELIQCLGQHKAAFFVLTAQSSALALKSSYALATTLIRQRFDIQETDPPALVQRRLRRGVRWFRAHAARLHRASAARTEHAGEEGFAAAEPLDDGDGRAADGMDSALKEIGALLGTERASAKGAVSDEGSAQARPRIAAAVARLVRVVAASMPVVILCDDVQWADDASLDLLDDLVVRVDDQPLLVVCAARDDLYERRPHWGEGKAWHQRVDLPALPGRAVDEMIKDRLRLVRDPSPAFVRTLAERADGNPLILEETMHLLVDAGVIEVKGEGPWELHEDRLGALELPATIQGIVQARLDRLEAGMRAEVARAAIVGRTFWAGAVAGLRARGEGGESSAAEPVWSRLRARQLVLARDVSRFEGEQEYVFAESATQQVAYEILPRRERREIHHLVAAWLRGRTPGDADAALLAWHYDRGGDDVAAAAEYARAGARAASLGQNAEARSHLERALVLHDEHTAGVAPSYEPGGPERRLVTWSDRVRLGIELGGVQRRLGRYDEAAAAYEAARAAVLRKERRRGQDFDRSEPVQWDARIDHGLALVHQLRGDNVAARALLERAIMRASQSGLLAETPAMYAALAIVLRRERLRDESYRAALTGLRVCRSLSRASDGARDDVARLLLGVAAAQFGRERWVATERTYRQVLRVIGEQGNPDLLGRALNGIGATHLERRNFRRAREMFLRALRVKDRAGDLQQLAVGYSNLAAVACAMGEHAEARKQARRAIGLAEKIQARSDLADMYRHLATAQAGTGALEDALASGRTALAAALEAAPLYVADVASTFTRVCVQASAADAPAVRHRARAEARALLAIFAARFTDGDLAVRAEECRALLAPILDSGEPR